MMVSHKAFTLVELLGVIVLLVVLFALAIPASMRAKDAALGARCSANLRDISVGLQAYISDHNGALLPSALAVTPGLPYRNWYEYLDRYMGTERDTFRDPPRPSWQLCPAKIIEPQTRHTVGYGWNTGFFGLDDSPTSRGNRSRITEVSHPAQTAIIGDSKDAHVRPQPANEFEHRILYATSLPTNPPRSQIARRHHGGGNYLFLDGHVEWHTPEALMASDQYIFKKVKP